MSPQGIALYDGGLYVANNPSSGDPQTIVTYNFTTQADGQFAGVNDITAPTSLAAVPGGLLLANSGGDIYSIALPAQTSNDVLTENGNGTFDFGGLAVSPAGTVYFIDYEGLSGCFYTFSLSGGENQTQIPFGDAGCDEGFLNGSIGGQAKFNLNGGPESIALDPTGTILYVADQLNNLIRAIDVATGIVSTYAGTQNALMDSDGAALSAGIVAPVALAVDGAGDVFVAETSGEGAVREISGSPLMVTTLFNGNACSVAFPTDTPTGIAVNTAGNQVYVSDSNNQIVWGLTGP